MRYEFPIDVIGPVVEEAKKVRVLNWIIQCLTSDQRHAESIILELVSCSNGPASLMPEVMWHFHCGLHSRRLL